MDTSAGARQHLDRAYDLLDQREYEDALAECQSAAELDPDCAEGHNLRGVVLDDSGRLEEAIAELAIQPSGDSHAGARFCPF